MRATAPPPTPPPARSPAPPGEPASAADRVRLPLLTLITQQSLDEDYRVAARRRAEAARLASADRPPADERAPRGRVRRNAAVVVAVFGVLATTAAVQDHRDAGLRTESRDSLITQIDAQKRRVATLQEREAALESRNAASQRRLARIATAASAADSDVTDLGARTGFGPVHGPGVRVTVVQQPDPDQDTTVQDSDLALLADGLWAAGAEAIAVNGQRLTAVTAIRTSGAAIEVNGNGIAPPYTVEAIGDEDSLQARLLDSSPGSTFAGYAADGYFSYTVHNESDLSLPAAPVRLRQLGSATPLPTSPGRGAGPPPTSPSSPTSPTSPQGTESGP